MLAINIILAFSLFPDGGREQVESWYPSGVEIFGWLSSARFCSKSFLTLHVDSSFPPFQLHCIATVHNLRKAKLEVFLRKPAVAIGVIIWIAYTSYSEREIPFISFTIKRVGTNAKWAFWNRWLSTNCSRGFTFELLHSLVVHPVDELNWCSISCRHSRQLLLCSSSFGHFYRNLAFADAFW